MSNIGSLELDITLRYFMHGTKSCHRVLVPPSSHMDCPVLHQEASMLKTCALEIPKQPTSSSFLIVSQLRAHYCCTTTAVWPVRTANNAAIRVRTLLLCHHCFMYTYRRERTTPTKLSLPRATALPRVGHGLTMSKGRFLDE